MPFIRRYGILLLAVLVFVAGCATTHVRHLASDASLIIIGKSTKNDVLTYMGEPDSERTVSPGVSQWVYYEQDKSLLQQIALVGKAFKPNGYGMVLITFKKNLVTDCRYSSFDKNEFNWANNYSWQDTKR